MKLSSIICVFVLCLFSVQLISQVNNNGLDQFGRPIQIDTTIDENDTTIVKNGFLFLKESQVKRPYIHYLSHQVDKFTINDGGKYHWLWA